MDISLPIITTVRTGNGQKKKRKEKKKVISKMLCIPVTAKPILLVHLSVNHSGDMFT